MTDKDTPFDEQVNRVLSFLDEIDLPYLVACVGEDSFLPGIEIQAGVLFIDLSKLAFPGDLLHEAGHIAVTPRCRRILLSGNMKNVGHTAGDEMAAIAWSWAAARHIDMAPSVLFHSHGYRGSSASLIAAFTQSQGFGHPLLYTWDMCEQPEHPQGFPRMRRWLRD